MNKTSKYSLAPSVALYSADQIKKIEQRYAQEPHTGTYALMEKAGASAFHHLISAWPDARKIIVVTGKGNNAGDGFIVATLAAERRLKVDLVHLADPTLLKGDALIAYKKMPNRVIKVRSVKEVKFSSYDVIVDAMLGTGIKGKLQEPYVTVIKRINANQIPVLAIDIPTGVEANTGFVHNEAVRANLTVTFVANKKGMYTGDSANYRGRVILSELDIPSHFYDQQTFHLFSKNWLSLKHKLKPREASCHKGKFGHTIIIGGHRGMSGAAVLASTAAARSGSGLTTAWVDDDCAKVVVSHTPEVMAKGIDIESIYQQVKSLIQTNATLVLGPGLGRTSWSKEWINALSENEELRKVNQIWDADALNWLSEFSDSSLNQHNSHRILTPHPGEAARLLGTSIDLVQQDRYQAAQSIASQYGGVCVLKGSGTIIADEHGFQVVCPVGNPGMASGGMGDVLAGLIGGLLAQGFSLMDAAMLGVCIHGEAADRAAGTGKHYRGLLASDLFEFFPALLNP